MQRTTGITCTTTDRLRIEPRHWYAWQMLPGYREECSQPYYSPIYVTRVIPRKTGQSILSLEFFNVLYLDGAQDFNLNIRLLRRYRNYLVADLLYPEESLQQVAIISRIKFGWLNQHCRHILEQYPPALLDQDAQENASTYLDAAFPYVKQQAALPI
ncbi:hypothetical protein SAMN05661010_03005 [Modicisalibacter muralis]|uniref:Uncharacterized protein n=1 Tax=Modicisalibacter muralis TaxID=119000 RepID=A0A1G9PCP2_9GAMM|nr:hypothetical protein [Halomonas muralis]SDL96528.1 hypothetical protein SAMN05661010_03005 [Halomonas muralis]